MKYLRLIVSSTQYLETERYTWTGVVVLSEQKDTVDHSSDIIKLPPFSSGTSAVE